MEDEFKALDALIQYSGQANVPFIFVGDQFVGGLADLKALEAKGDLAFLLKGLKNHKYEERIV
jgi:glutaredoxin